MRIGCRAALPRVVGLLLFADYLFLALRRDVPVSIPILVGVTAMAVILLAVLFYGGGKEEIQLSPGAILGFALACRLLFVLQAPQLSDDIYRYLWDGLQTLHGNNPYSRTPAASVAFDGWSATILNKVNHPLFHTIYPPAAQVIFAAGAALAKGYGGLKVVLVTLDMATCMVIIALLRTMNLPVWRAVLYAWHPLPIIEIAWSGHIDVAAVLFLFAAVALVIRSGEGADLKKGLRGTARVKTIVLHSGAGAAVALSILVKVIPLIYLPVLLCAAIAPLYLAGGCVSALALFSIPFLPDLSHMLASLGIYLQNWEFANAAFRTLRTLLDSGSQTRMVLASLSVALILVITILFRRRTRQQGSPVAPGLMDSLYLVTFVYLLLAPTLHPWYALYLAALLPFSAGPAGLVLSWAVFLAYHVTIRYSILGEWAENDLIAAVIWLSPVLAWSITFFVRRFSRLATSSSPTPDHPHRRQE